MKRYCETFIYQDVIKKMVFIGGPRQVGKTTLGKVIDLIEVKSSDTTISTSLKYYSQKLKPKNTVQIVGQLTRSFNQDHILVTNPGEFFKNPPWEA